MSLHSDASDELKAMWKNKTMRMNTVFGRLASFVNWPEMRYSAVELAEAGLVNV